MMKTQSSSVIKVESQPSHEKLSQLGIFSWPIWTKEVSEFPWVYDAQETCYLLEGEVIVTPENGESVTFGKGDLVIFPQGMRCTWKILKDVKKHYNFS